MILLSLLATTTLISLSQSSPLSYATYRRRGLIDADDDRVYLPYVPDGTSVNDIYWLSKSQEPSIKIFNNSESGIDRVKKIQSLSVTNSLDVLRQRVMLELARRKAQQDQKQIDANRRFLDNIGKRSSHMDAAGFPHFLDSTTDLSDHLTRNRQQFILEPKTSLHRNLDWYGVGNTDPYNDDEQFQKIETNDLHML